MSANNQTLVVEYKEKWYIFTNVMAESWINEDNGKENELSIKEADGVFDTRDDAFDRALELDGRYGQFKEGTEYGVQFNRLCKDDAKVNLIE